MITLDLNHFGFQRAGRPERRKQRREVEKEEKKVPNPGPTSMVVSSVGRIKASMVVSWTLSLLQEPTRGKEAVPPENKISQYQYE